MKHRLPRLCLALLFCCATFAPARAQEARPCQPPVLPASLKEQNIFTPQQEMDLGDVVAERAQRDFRVIGDEELNGHLRRVGARLVAHLPPSEMRYQFFLIDLPDVNAFALPGGRIYVTRKLVAFVRSEDELAGVVAHELGHLLARQQSADMTRLLREVLGVTEVTDRRDIFEKYNRLIDNIARKPGAARGDAHAERKQIDADLLGLYAMAAAGYDPQAAATAFDRVAETKGKTGGWFSDLFGATRPEARRLREIVRGIQALPAECRTARAAAPSGEFEKWQAAVVAYAGAGRREALHSVLSKRELDPPLRGEINHLRFSPDGRYLLAQDDSGINVLTREPLAPLFRIEAPEARPAQFTPDSKGVVFHNSGLRVEAWDVAGRKATAVRELFVRGGCLQTELAPDGRTLACLDTDSALTLYDVASGAQVFQKKDFFKPDSTDLFNFILIALLRAWDVNAADLPDIEWVRMSFSPDARYFAAGQAGSNLAPYNVVTADSPVIAFDLGAGAALPARGELKKILSGKFTFLGPDRVIGVNVREPRKSGIVGFPSGEVVEQFYLAGWPHPVARGNYVMLRPVENHPVGVLDLSTKQVVMANRRRAFDVYGDVFASEQVGGEVAVYGVGDKRLRAKVVVPRNPLGRLRAAAVSPDFKWLAVSERSRGAVWDLTKGERVFLVRGFRGAHFAEDGTLHADFPQLDAAARNIARLSAATREAAEGPKVEETWRAVQRGPFVVVTRPQKKNGDLSENVTLEVRDARTGATLWTRDFPKEAPRVWADPQENSLILSWPTKAGAARAEIKGDARLSQQLAAMKEKEGDYFLQTLDARTGRTTGALLVETGRGSFKVSGVASAGDLLVISDTENRVLVYSLSSGEQKGRFFGGRAAVSRAANLLAVENESGQLAVYDLATAEKRDEFNFASRVSLAHFSPDGRRLFVLTADQTAYVLDLAAGQ